MKFTSCLLRIVVQLNRVKFVEWGWGTWADVQNVAAYLVNLNYTSAAGERVICLTSNCRIGISHVLLINPPNLNKNFLLKFSLSVQNLPILGIPYKISP